MDLVRIIPDPNQPRKFFDPAALDELTASVREKGVIQPIVIRPTSDGKFMVVTGERRYRAAMAVFESDKSKKSIPAVIRELDDTETLELQIIENLQRKEVHPMEEAQGFKKLHIGGMASSVIAQKVGKSESYVLKRMKLTELYPIAQKIFLANRMDYSEALKLSRLDEKSQIEIIEDAAGGGYNWDILDDYSKVAFLKLGYRLDNKTVELSKASFDKSDPTLHLKSGPCIGCAFNSESNPDLFETKKSICHRPSCFTIKKDADIERKIEQAKSNPEMILVATYLYDRVDVSILEKLRKKGNQILDDNDYWRRDAEIDKLLSFEQYVEEEISENLTEMNPEELEEAKSDYEAYKENWEKAKKEIQEKIESGKWKKAFCVLGHYEGQFIYIELRNKGKAQQPNLESGSEPNQALHSAIVDIQMSEVRAVELDFNKKWAMARKAHLMDPSTGHLVPGTGYPQVNFHMFLPSPWLNAWVLAMWNDVYYYLSPANRQKFDLPDRENKWLQDGGPCPFDSDQILQLIRFWVIRKLDAVDPDGARANTIALYEILRLTHPDEIEAIDAEIEKKAKARRDRNRKKIQDLDAKIKEEEGKSLVNQLDLFPETIETVEENG